jgi:hypothetical protein
MKMARQDGEVDFKKVDVQLLCIAQNEYLDA